MKKLDQYFEKARTEKSLVSLTEVEKILREHKSSLGTEKAQGGIENFVNLHTFQRLAIVAVVVFLLLTGGFLIWDKKITSLEKTEFYGDHISPAQKRWINLVSNIKNDQVNSPIRLVGYNSLSKGSILPLHMRTKLELDETTLKAIGIRLEEDKIIYEGNIGTQAYVKLSVKFFASGGTAQEVHGGGLRKDIQTYDFRPLFMTDENGGPCVRYQLSNEPKNKLSREYFNSVVDELIPVQVKGPIGEEKFIFWYTSNSALLEILEKKANIFFDVKMSGPEPSTAKDIRLYPTITKSKVTLSIDNKVSRYMTADLLDLSGTVQQQPLATTWLKKGTQEFEFNISDLKTGIYFLRLRSSSGEQSIHRIFKE